MTIQPYVRRAQYYETDQMAIIHHSNYIRWFEEARVDLMDQIGYTYAQMEADGINSPLIGVSCDYKAPVRFGDTVEIRARVRAFNGVRLTVGYTVTDAASGEIRTLGETRHCFSRADGRPVSLKRVKPEAYTLFLSCVEET